ncbi:unnamed protein product, partial [Medioppia subpectinata]
MGSRKRINNEIKEIMKDNNLKKNHWCIELDGENTSHFFGKIHGPPDTPYQNGVFRIDISIPERYPIEPPKCKFLTLVWHPNVSSQTGVICLDLLTKDNWSAGTTIEALLRSLRSFLSSPESTNPQDGSVARQYRTNRQLYDRTARYWTYYHAMNDETRKTVDKNQFQESTD